MVKVDKDVPHRPFNVSCLMHCRGEEPLLASVVIGLGGVSADGCQQFSPDSMVHRNSGVFKHGASCLHMSEDFLSCGYTGEDAFAKPVCVVLPDLRSFAQGNS